MICNTWNFITKKYGTKITYNKKLYNNPKVYFFKVCHDQLEERLTTTMSKEDDLLARITKRTKGSEIVKSLIYDEMKKSNNGAEDQVMGVIFFRIESFDAVASQGKGPIFASYIPLTNEGAREALSFKFPRRRSKLIYVAMETNMDCETIREEIEYAFFHIYVYKKIRI